MPEALGYFGGRQVVAQYLADRFKSAMADLPPRARLALEKKLGLPQGTVRDLAQGTATISGSLASKLLSPLRVSILDCFRLTKQLSSDDVQYWARRADEERFLFVGSAGDAASAPGTAAPERPSRRDVARVRMFLVASALREL